jgi:hypothetical protein
MTPLLIIVALADFVRATTYNIFSITANPRPPRSIGMLIRNTGIVFSEGELGFIELTNKTKPTGIAKRTIHLVLTVKS